MLLRGHHTRRRSSAALPIALIVSGNWYKRLRSGRSLFRREVVASRKGRGSSSRIHAVEKSFNHGWTQMNTDRKRNSAKQTSSPISEAFPSLKRPFALVLIRNTILQLRARTTKIWTAVAERSGDTAFRTAGCFQKRRGASLPAAVQKIVVAAKGPVRFIRVHPWSN